MVFVEGLFFWYFALAVLYIFILSIAGHFYKRNISDKSIPKRIAVLVPGYKEDGVILFVAESLSKLDYPKDLFDIIIIADSFKPETIDELSKLPVILIPVQFDKSSKSKSLNYALNIVEEKYDIAVILDADNVVLPDFLASANNAFNSGYHAIQAQRVAKNINTPFAILDAASEAINNHLFRKGANALGLSASLIGSGIILDYSVLKRILITIDSVYEDRELQIELAKELRKIHYLEDIVVFDEKVDNSASYQNQRKRWFYAQLIFLKDHFFKGFYFLSKGNINFFNLSILNNIFPPRLITLFLLMVITIISFSFSTEILFSAKWAILLFLYVMSLFFALPKRFYTTKMVKALAMLPILLLKYVEILIGMRTAGKQFIHTPHSKVDVDHSFYTDK